MAPTRAAAARRLGCRIAAGFVGMVALVGCGAPAGDGKIADDWPAMADATVPVPPVGACYDTALLADAREPDLARWVQVACTGTHVIETFHVAQFPPEVAARQTVPPARGTELRTAFVDCEAKAKEYLGGDWYTGRLYLIFTSPTSRQWEGGGRHYRCDLAEVATALGSDIVRRSTPMRDGLRGDRPLASTCFDFVNETPETYDDMRPVDCAAAHDTEFAGVFEAVGDMPPADEKKQSDVGFPGCDRVVATYIGGTPERMQVGGAYWGFVPDDWARGDRRVRCYAAKPEGKKLVGSVKGIGNARPRTT